MKLVRMRIKNFRCYKEEISIDFDDMTALIGKNDAGKSTVMDALDIFLNDGAPDKHDASKGGDAKDLSITCEFSNLPDGVVLDEESETTFENEHLLNAAGNLEITKTYSGHLNTPKCTSIVAHAIHPTAGNAKNLLQLKNPQLKKRAEELGVILDGIDKKVNAQLRHSIREHIGDLELKPVEVPLNEDNAKKTWDGIKTYIPIFALFKSDRASTDQDPEAQDPLKAAVKEAVKQKEIELNMIAQHVKEEVKRIADKTLEKIKEMDPGLASQLNPQITEKKWESLFSVSITGDEDIPINKRGSGVKRLILLNFFRAKAEQEASKHINAPVIYAIEEPETSQHPHNQRLLVSALIDLSADNQVVITTHTPMLARAIPDQNLRFIHHNDDDFREIYCGGGETNKMIANSLGVLPDNAIKLFLGVEGKHDIAFLKYISGVLRRDGKDVLDLEEMELNGELIFFPLGGSSLALWTSRLEPLSRPEFHLFDRDTAPPEEAKYQKHADEINNRDRCKAVITQKREMENYLHYEAINEAYEQVSNIELGLNENFGEHDDVPLSIAKNVHELSGSPNQWEDLKADAKDKKISKAKRILNHVAAPLMTIDRLDEIDPDKQVLSWFQDMEQMIEN
jgi:putative ATP-dependent endonuclease of the OLD family